MPQSGNSVSVEAVDSVFQTKMLDMLKQTDRHEMVVGWYHSHPGYGPWLSGVDINTQQSFEQLNPKAVAVVVDPVQSVKGKVVIDAFRLINPQIIMMGNEPRQTTSNLEQMNPPSIVALVHGLNKHYYSIAINYRKNELEQDMLLNLQKNYIFFPNQFLIRFKKKWSYGLTLENMDNLSKRNENTLKEMSKLSKNYSKWIDEEMKKSSDEMIVANVGKPDPKRHLSQNLEEALHSNISQTLSLIHI
eukprot:TRINITY_DN6259_c0_g1_i2.p1 TRINITY_DN6259_c0_g1~~TRINITY_DN6259_c0_g1_i2.p1  ORF type:complete len:246 (-),score=41.52 TRINITY_DN6259_c0_g1_i2:122-859(-)